MSVNESQIKNTTAGAIDDDDAVIFKERKRLLSRSAVDFHKIYRHTVLYHCRVRTLEHHRG